MEGVKPYPSLLGARTRKSKLETQKSSRHKKSASGSRKNEKSKAPPFANIAQDRAPAKAAQGRAGWHPAATREFVWRKKSRLVDPSYAEGMVGDVVLEIGEAKKDFKDFFIVGGITIELALRESVDGVWRVGEEPGEDFFVDQACFNAPGAHLIRALDYHFEEMIEADAVDRHRARPQAAPEDRVRL